MPRLRGQCAAPSCDSTYSPHKWGCIKAARAGWFIFKKNRVSWCPEHLPDWVEQWRGE